jgi:Heavy metal associated domain 2
MAAHDLQILHAIPGRIRVKIARLKDNPSLADELQQQLMRIRVVHQAVVNPITGSVLVTYDPHVLESLNSLELGDTHLLDSMHELLALADLLGIRPQDVDTQALEDWFQAHTNEVKPPASSTVAGTVTTFFGALNAKVAQASSGWSDLKALVPVVLFGLGLRGLWLVEKVPFPAWYDYFWFAFGTFIALHPASTSKT